MRPTLIVNNVHFKRGLNRGSTTPSALAVAAVGSRAAGDDDDPAAWLVFDCFSLKKSN